MLIKIFLFSALLFFSQGAAAQEDKTCQEILESPIPVVALFDAKWNLMGRELREVLDDYVHRFSGRLKVVFLEADENEAFAKKHGLVMVPIVLHFSQGQLTEIQRGLLPAKEYLRKLGEHLTAEVAGP